MKSHLICILLVLPFFPLSAQDTHVILAKISVDHQPWNGNENAGTNDAKVVLVAGRHEMMLQQFTDTSIAYLINATHHPVYRHDDKFQDVFLKPFTSNKKIIRRSHADYGFVVNVTLGMNDHTDLFGTVYIEPYINVRIEMKDAAGTTIWHKEGYAEAPSAPAHNFNAPNGKVYTEEVCGYDGALQLFSQAMVKALATFDYKSISMN